MMSDGTVAGMVSGTGQVLLGCCAFGASQPAVGRRPSSSSLVACLALHPPSSCLHTLPQRCLTPRTLTPLHCTVPFLLPAGRELMAEMAAKRERERQRFADLEADVTGRGAQTVGG